MLCMLGSHHVHKDKMRKIHKHFMLVKQTEVGSYNENHGVTTGFHDVYTCENPIDIYRADWLLTNKPTFIHVAGSGRFGADRGQCKLN